MITLDFVSPTIKDSSWIKPMLASSCNLGCENAFGSIFVWGDFYGLKVFKYKDFLLRKFIEDNKECFMFPAGTGDLFDCINTLLDYSKNNKIDFSFSGLTQNNIELLEEIFPNKFEYFEQPSKEDYIYNTSDLINLKGRKYHSKRNHIAKFSRLYDWSFEQISEENIEDCKKFCEQWFCENSDDKRADIIHEKEAIKKALTYYNDLDCIGGIIKVNEKIVALTCGEKINKYIFVIHFEKALKDYKSAYAVINNEFAKHYLSSFIYVNREEDLGIPGLKKAKLSYHPIALLKRYKAILA